MYTITDNFKTAIRGSARQVRARILNGEDIIADTDDLQSLEIISDGSLCRTVMRQAKCVYFGDHNMLGNWVSPEVGVVLPNATTEYINYGGFKVVEVTEDIGGLTSTAKLYDRMYEALQPYALTPTYPITLLQLLQAICTELGWTLATTTFANSTISIERELFTESQLTYRQVLDMIAEASGTIIFFNKDDELELKTISDSVLETLTTGDLISLKLETMYGELNSVVLSRQPQEDNIVQKDDESIAIYGLNEFKIVNNYILDNDRETYITPIFNVLNGIKYYPFKAQTIGLGYYEVGDRIKVTDLGGNQYEVLVMNINLKVSGSLIETIEAKIPEKTSTNYDYAGIIGRTIKNTEIKVDKQQGEIQLLNSKMEIVAIIPRQTTAPENPEINDLWLNTNENVLYIYTGEQWLATAVTPSDLEDYYTKGETTVEIGLVADAIRLSVEELDTRLSTAENDINTAEGEIIDVKQDVASLELRADSLELNIESVGGTNLLKNSAGLKGSIEEWQKFDAEGNLLDINNNGTTVSTSDIMENTESGSGIRIEEQYVVQSVQTIIGMPYTFYLRFKKLLNLDLTITGVTGTLSITAGDYVDETWAVYQYQFVANSGITEVKISNVDSGEGAYAILSDMVLKAGIVSGWVQAPNEVYGKNYRFDASGFSVTSPTDNFKAVLDNTKLGIYDTTGTTDRVLALFSKDAGLITRLVAQEEFQIQRYQNSEKATRFIPTDTGCMITVNN